MCKLPLFLILQLGTGYDNTTVRLREVASQTISGSRVDVGDTFTFELAVDLAHVINPADLNVEIFGMEPDEGL